MPSCSGPPRPSPRRWRGSASPSSPVALAAQVFVTQPPCETPTGTYLGVVALPAAAARAAGMELGRCVDDEPDRSPPDLPERRGGRAAGRRTTSLAVAVCDEQRRLLGAVTVDDVLDRTLPAGWRQRRR